MASTEKVITSTWSKIAQNTDTMVIVGWSVAAEIEIISTAADAAPTIDGKRCRREDKVDRSKFGAGYVWARLVPGSRYPALTLLVETSTTALGVMQVTGTFWQATQPVSLATNTPTLAAGTNLAGDVGLQVRANATGAATPRHIVAAAGTNATNVKNAAGRVLGWSFANVTAAWKYVKLHNNAAAPTAGAGVFMTIGIPPNGRSEFSIGQGIGFSAGIGFTITNLAADADTTAVVAGDVVGDLIYA